MTSSWTLDIPEAWQTADIRPAFTKPIVEVKLPKGRAGLVVLTMLKDGTNIVALTWDRGQRFARIGAPTNGKLEERFTGRPPGAGEGNIVKAWRRAVDALLSASKEAKDYVSFNPAVDGDLAAVACMHDPVMLDKAYEIYCDRSDARGEDPVSHEVFEQGIEILAAEQIEQLARKLGDD